ncbi:MAG: hypothetical protein ACRD5G_01725 [Candidatus Acidiferrales bacterium]
MNRQVTQKVTPLLSFLVSTFMAHDDVAMVQSATRPGKLESVNIEIAENGFLVSCHYKPKKSKKNEPAPKHPFHAARMHGAENGLDIRGNFAASLCIQKMGVFK